MKRIFTIILSFIVIGLSNAQTPIIITADEIPIPTTTFNLDNVTGLIPNPTPSANFTWDYGTINGNTPVTVTYFPETIPGFTAEGIDVFFPTFKSLTSSLPTNLGYNLDSEIDFNDNGVEDKGSYVSPQVYSIGAMTGNPKDSIYFPEQGYVWGSSRQIMQFPFTYQDTWTSVSVRQTDFQITVTAFGLNKAEATQLYAIVRNDTIAGWGKLRVYTPNGPSKYYDVLVDQITEFAIDSFYLGGAPAPSTVLTPFGMTQGQITDVRNRLNVYREGSYQYLFSTFYGPNDHSSTPLSEFVNTDNLVTSNYNPSEGDYSVLLYPNPCKGNEINIKVYGSIAALNDYTIVDIMGRTISSGKLDNTLGTINLRLPENCVNGTYFVYLNDEKGKTVINEEFVIQH